MVKEKQKTRKTITDILIIIPTTIIVAAGLWVFVYRADFAPSGVDGLATILQYLTKINAGVFTFLLNLPLLVVAWFILKKRYVIYTLIYTVTVSLSLLVFEKVELYQYTQNDALAAVFGGVVQGLTGILLKIGGSSGGADVLGCLFQKKAPHKEVEKLISFFSYIVVAIGFAVYGNLHSVLLSVIEIFVCERVTYMILKDRRNAVKFEVVADAETIGKLKEAIIKELEHGVTIIDAEGGFSSEQKKILSCLVNYREIPDFLRLIKSTDGIFAYYSDVLGVKGNFDR